MVSSPRRSSRRRSSKSTFRFRDIPYVWKRQYLDFGHCRINRCTRRLLDATDAERDELKSMGLSFVAMSISAAASTSGLSRQEELIEYAKACVSCNLDPNDEYNGETAVALAAYFGLSNLLILLLDMGCPLKKEIGERNAIFASIRNGQHVALEILLSRRTEEATKVICQEEHSYKENGHFHSSIVESIVKGDVTSVHLLLQYGCATMSDLDCKMLYRGSSDCRRLERVLTTIYPHIPNVMHWCGELSWSYPKTDRETLNILLDDIRRDTSPETLPSEVWQRVFSFVGRGWFACRRYHLIGRPNETDILQRNIINA